MVQMFSCNLSMVQWETSSTSLAVGEARVLRIHRWHNDLLTPNLVQL